MLKPAFREEILSRIQTSDWFTKFRSGVTSINIAEQGSRHPSLIKTGENVV
jgi:hypothetical protein